MLNDLIDGALSFVAFIFDIIVLMILWVAFSKYIVGIVAGGLFIFFPLYFQHKKNQKERLLVTPTTARTSRMKQPKKMLSRGD
ncbi:hypothetical protein [Lentilactobacillus diolivorans]|uniref:Uncharacterized protein n=2 Tax=Lentilactobacillus diolivorans TaxID=179838 RepID=A0A0R1S2X3_9LACO|nr:hypothetical protein [Lentilactobacillus diolivorans]KRL63574.1 hypothetical protein FC85_GL001557 [Lentilactobacillus diolivorans DSM 14421]GEP25233.1 hypothetical protein LDI01_28260 [Lentilactobacillus diolivorans]